MNRPIAPEVVEAELARLPDMSLDELKARWLEFKGVPLPKFMRRGLITRAVAHASEQQATTWNAVRYRSLSDAARRITGSRRNGRVFFRLKRNEGRGTRVRARSGRRRGAGAQVERPAGAHG